MTILPKKKLPKEPRQPNKDQASTSGAGETRAKRRKPRPPQERNEPRPNNNNNNNDGYNSEDEHDERRRNIEDDELEARFEEHLRKSKRLHIKQMKGDGNCLFRAVADQVYGDEEMHANVRKLCMDYMVKNADYFSQFITEDFQEYVARKRNDGQHGNHVEIQGMAEIFNRPIELYEYSIEPINIFQPEGSKENPPIRLSYHGTTHYNSVVDPYAATIGVGLGLAQFHPGLADKNLMNEAIATSEQHEIEEAMLKDKLRATELESMSDQMNEQVARDSYMQWLRDQDTKQFSPRPSTSQKSSSKPASPKTPGPSTSQKPTSKPPSPKPSTSTASAKSVGSGSEVVLMETASMNEIPPCAFGLSDWGQDSDMLAQVLAISQQEYLDSLKKSKDSPEPDDQPSTSS